MTVGSQDVAGLAGGGAGGIGGEFDFSEAMGNFALGAQGVMGLAGAYNAYQQNKLMKEQFGFNKALANRNIASSGTAYNTSENARTNVAAQMYENVPGSAGFIAKKEELFNPVDVTPIGA